jgi:hypothetical protein
LPPTLSTSFMPSWLYPTADAFDQFLDQSGVNQRIYALLDETDIDDVSALAKAGAQEECLLLTGEGSIRHIFRRRGRAHGKRGLGVIGGQLVTPCSLP